MRHDAKLGLALGMLVMGFAIAFCFPRRVQITASQVAVPAPIPEQEFELLPIKAYQPRSADSATSLPAETATDPDDAPDDVRELPVAAAPEPISPLVAESSLSDVLKLSRKGDDSEVKPQPVLEPAAKAVATKAARPETYRVRAGDTLSEIALKVLGKTSRYQEIYEANKDRLASPDDLRIGLELRVPPRHPRKDTAFPEGSSPAAESKTGLAKDDPQQTRPSEDPQPTLAERPSARH